jgi:FAD/FMN-containing dehydrogenase
VEVARAVAPENTQALVEALRGWPGRVAVGGGRFSMGGQVAIAAGLHLDMRRMNRLVGVKAEEQRVRVQAGMRWRDLQDVLDPLGLSVHTMQSFSSFTVGGSVSVNAHGRYVGNGPVGNSVAALQLVLADGSVVESNRVRNAELFRAAIGGYGAVGVITEVELHVVPNVRMERSVREIALAQYMAYFDGFVRDQPRVVLHNADLRPPRFDQPLAITWHQTARPVTVEDRLIPRHRNYALEQNLIWLITELPATGRLRDKVVEPLRYARPAVVWRNYEASLDVAELEPRTRRISTYVLQEYFIPRAGFLGFARAIGELLVRRNVEALNVSIRHSPPDTLSLLPWARQEVFCFVLYFKQRTHASAMKAVEAWTRELIDVALAHGGRYYLPYQLHATREQFERAYPEAEALRELKARVDPDGRFSNQLWEKYL